MNTNEKFPELPKQVPEHNGKFSEIPRKILNFPEIFTDIIGKH